MPKKLKSFVTQSGFFELAIAAPSMKAATDARGLPANVFQQGFAQQTDDPAIIAATMAQPGTILKRAVGSKDAFKENAELPASLPAVAAPRPVASKKVAKAKPAPKSNVRWADPAQIISFQRAQAKRDAARAKEEAEQQREEAERAREEERRQRAAGKAQAVLDRARERHDATMKAIERERLVVERKADAETARWEKEKRALEQKLREIRA